MSFQRITTPDAFQLKNETVTGINPNNIIGLDNRPLLSAAELKKRFDKAGGDLKEYLAALAGEINGLIDALEASAAAGNIGVPAVLTENTESNIQAELAVLKNYMDNLVITAGAGDMAKSVYADNGQEGKVNVALTAENAEKLGGIAVSGFSKEITGQTAKSTLADSDAFPIADSESGGVQKKTLWSTIKSTMQTAFTNTFAAKAHRHPFVDLDGTAAYEHAHSGIYALSIHSHPYSQLSGVAMASHSHGVTDVSGAAKSAGGIRIFIGGESQAGAANGDLWFNS